MDKPVFPQDEEFYTGEDIQFKRHGGMTLRDYAAVQYSAALLVNGHTKKDAVELAINTANYLVSRLGDVGTKVKE